LVLKLRPPPNHMTLKVIKNRSLPNMTLLRVEIYKSETISFGMMDYRQSLHAAPRPSVLLRAHEWQQWWPGHSFKPRDSDAVKTSRPGLTRPEVLVCATQPSCVWANLSGQPKTFPPAHSAPPSA
jgi:hypothetical protein